ncbi:hypothetical protein Godav_025142, partial [Gossypium davidsonii]|nr:hypothetical protein [Gossypium davidsonii]
MLKEYPKKSTLKEKPVGKALVLGSSTKGVEAKEVENEKSVECFFCHGPHRLRKHPRKSVIEGNDKADNEPKKLGSSKGKVEAKRVKRNKKKRVKATCELGESSEKLLPNKEVSLLSNLEGKVAIKTVKLRPMRLKLSKASELTESSTRLPPMGEVGGALNFKEKEVMHVRQLTKVNAKVYSKHFDSVLHSYLLTWQERKGPFEVFEQRGRETVGKAKPSVVNQ